MPAVERAFASTERIELTGKLLTSAEDSAQPVEEHALITEDHLVRDVPLTRDTTCGFWIFRGSFYQKFATQTAYIVVYGIAGCIFSMTYAYFNGTITTIEKRFHIPSKHTGIITSCSSISQMLTAGILSYYGGKGHRPRWMGLGMMSIVLFCLLNVLPHLLYGSGTDALSLTEEFGALSEANELFNLTSLKGIEKLCNVNGDNEKCIDEVGYLTPQLIFLMAQLIAGIGGSMYFTLGTSYMDDNTEKSKTPAFLSLSYFLHMLGPAVGYALASLFLRVFISPQFHPIIDNKDPRWLGAWWMGWLLLAALIFITALLLGMFPKELPGTVARRLIKEKCKEKTPMLENNELKHEKEALPNVGKDDESNQASLRDMWVTFKRLMYNKTYMYNNFSSVFYFFGYMPYWIFTPKYIEVIYRQSAATSSMVTGTVALAFSAIGVLLSGIIISKYKPRARYLAGWNVIVGLLTVVGIVAYVFIGCSGNEKSVVINMHDSALSNATTCNSACHCDYVRYSPVCGENNMTYISPCHAGCKKQLTGTGGKKYFYDCACIPHGNDSNLIVQNIQNIYNLTDNFTLVTEFSYSSQAIDGACPVQCFTQFVIFLCVMCFLKFIGATGRASNFLVTVRCVLEEDKTAAMGFGMMLISLLTFIPSPIFFGWVLDSLCLVWGKTCTNQGNCWLYDPELLRYKLNFLAAVFILIGTILDGGVWYYVKDLQIFDEKVETTETNEELSSSTNIKNGK